jgi:hypothetical protein
MQLMEIGRRGTLGLLQHDERVRGTRLFDNHIAVCREACRSAFQVIIRGG